jgi:hypothetical protein
MPLRVVHTECLLVNKAQRILSGLEAHVYNVSGIFIDVCQNDYALAGGTR